MRKWIALALLALTIMASGQQIQHGVILSWSWSGTGTPTYSVYRATVSGGEAKPALATGITPMTYNDSTAAWNTKYFYTVTATVGGVESAPSMEVSALITVPNSPTSPGTTVY
jgi:fibronectin type 3 domain-containing protein